MLPYGMLCARGTGMATPIRTDEAARRYLADAGVLASLTLDGDIVVEIKECYRCGGSGRHSFNLRDLDLCWGCSGNPARARRTLRTPIKKYAQIVKRKRAVRERAAAQREERDAVYAARRIESQLDWCEEASVFSDRYE